MTEAQVPQLVIRAAVPEDEPELLAWLLDDRRPAETAARQGQLFEARRLDQRVGALWANVAAGRVACLIGPRTTGPHAVDVGRQLIRHATKFVADQGVRVAQAILSSDAQAQIGFYDTVGFPHALDLDYLVCSLDELPRSADDGKSEKLSFAPYRAALADRFERILAQTYEASQDCPILNGVRDVRDVMAGYRATGVYADHWWLLIQYDGQDAGCLILTDHPAEHQMELIYLGIAPEFRGKGLGLAATRHAQALARRTGRPRLILAVDSTNGPAQAVYQQTGFLRWDRKKVLLRFF